MLVLTRRIGEEIILDGDIIITVVGVKGSAVRLGITAPPSVRVLRREMASLWNEFTGGTSRAAKVPSPCAALCGVPE